jgi:hypothetical protein
MSEEFDFPEVNVSPEGHVPTELDYLMFVQRVNQPERGYEVIARLANFAAILRDKLVDALILVQVAKERGMEIRASQAEIATIFDRLRTGNEMERKLLGVMGAMTDLNLGIMDVAGIKITHEEMDRRAAELGFPRIKNFPRDEGLPPSQRIGEN